MHHQNMSLSQLKSTGNILREWLTFSIWKWIDYYTFQCQNNIHNCDVNANCTNTVGGFECECNEGLFGNGTHCEDINECADDAIMSIDGQGNIYHDNCFVFIFIFQSFNLNY